MENNLHISYDLIEPGKNYSRVIETLKSLGSWAKIHYSFWYVKSSYSAVQARDLLVAALDAKDSLYVVDSTNNLAAWHNLSAEVGNAVRQRWASRAAA